MPWSGPFKVVENGTCPMPHSKYEKSSTIRWKLIQQFALLSEEFVTSDDWGNDHMMWRNGTTWRILYSTHTFVYNDEGTSKKLLNINGISPGSMLELIPRFIIVKVEVWTARTWGKF